jgi:hypothetical protein
MASTGRTRYPSQSITCPAETMPHDRNQKLILVHASKSRPGKRSADDYDVWDGSAKVVGRIFRATATPPGRPWFWMITDLALQRPTELGYAASCEEALAAFKQAWHSRPDE